MAGILGILFALSMAAFITFTGSSGLLAASATFTVAGGFLEILLVNTAAVPTAVNGEVLTGIFFDVTGSPALAKSSASTTGTILGPTGGQSFDQQWAFKVGGGPRTYGIGAVGFGVFGGADAFTTGGSSFPGSPGNGVEWGLVATGSTLAGIAGALEPFVINSGKFKLSGASGLSESAITNVRFQYGSSLTETSFPGTGCVAGAPGCPTEERVPEPGTYALLGAGLGALALVKRIRA